MGRFTFAAIGMLIVAPSLAGCNRGADQGVAEAERAIEDARGAADDATEGTERLAESLKGMADGLASMAGEAARSSVEPIDFRELQQLFPEVDGWVRGTPSGQKMTTPVAFAQAEVVYTDGTNGRVEAKIVDSAFQGLLIAPVKMLLGSGFEREDEFSYQRSTSIDGSPGWETWDAREGEAQLTVILNDRFLLTLEARNLTEPDVLQQIVRGIDRSGLPTADAPGQNP